MNMYNLPLDKKLCDRIHTNLFSFLTGLQVKFVFDIHSFIKNEKRHPCISSIFLVGDNPGGSYDFENNGRTIYVHNGTLVGYDVYSVKYITLMYEQLVEGKKS